MTTYQIDVTREDIRTGKRVSPQHCAVAKAASRALGQPVIVGSLLHLDDGRVADLPKEASRFIQRFDVAFFRCWPFLRPFSFSVTVALLLMLPMMASAQTFTGDVVINGRLIVNTPRGQFVLQGNELEVRSTIDDPPKVRLAAIAGKALGAVSFSRLRADGGQEEVALISGSLADDDPLSLGGEIRISLRRKYAHGDAAMITACVISGAYTTDGWPVVRCRNAVSGVLSPFRLMEPTPRPLPWWLQPNGVPPSNQR